MRGVYFILMFGSLCYGEPYLFSHAEQKTLDKTQKLPNRVYAYIEEGTLNLIYLRSNLKGQFRSPEESLHQGTVLSGAEIGATNRRQHFKLTEKGDWEPTEDEWELRLFVRSNPPRLKVITLTPPQDKAPKPKYKLATFQNGADESP